MRPDMVDISSQGDLSVLQTLDAVRVLRDVAIPELLPPIAVASICRGPDGLEAALLAHAPG